MSIPSRKAVLVIDMPYDCYDCKVASNPLCKGLRNVTANSCISGQRPPYCPLKPLPEKSIYSSPFSDDVGNVRYNDGFQDGWNACIDEIVGEGNETD